MGGGEAEALGGSTRWSPSGAHGGEMDGALTEGVSHCQPLRAAADGRLPRRLRVLQVCQPSAGQRQQWPRRRWARCGCRRPSPHSSSAGAGAGPPNAAALDAIMFPPPSSLAPVLTSCRCRAPAARRPSIPISPCHLSYQPTSPPPRRPLAARPVASRFGEADSAVGAGSSGSVRPSALRTSKGKRNVRAGGATAAASCGYHPCGRLARALLPRGCAPRRIWISREWVAAAARRRSAGGEGGGGRWRGRKGRGGGGGVE